MRRVSQLTLVIVLVWIAAPATGAVRNAGRGGTPITVACSNRGMDRFTFDQAPRRCLLVTREGGDPTIVIGTIELGSMKWKHWGRAHTKGKGEFGWSNGTPVEVTLSKPISMCDRRVYTKVKVRTPELPGLGSRASGTLLHNCRFPTRR